MKRLGWSLAALLLAVVFGLALSRLIGASTRESRISCAFGTMGTRAECTFYDCDRERAEAALAAVKREFDRVAQACNLYDPQSELSQLNRTADKEFFVCSPLLWHILTEARRAHAASSGAFDITVKPLMDLRGFYRKRNELPSPEELAATLKFVGLDKLEWDDVRRAVRFRTSGMGIDLGGIAKGYALDLAAAAVRELGVESGVIDLGGNLYLLPEPPPERENYRIGIRSPSGTGDSGEVLELQGPCAVSTSGSYERFIVLEGRRFGHVVDPATGEAPYLDHSATAVAPTGIEADWLSSAAFLRGEELVPQLKNCVPGSEITLTASPAAGGK